MMWTIYGVVNISKTFGKLRNPVARNEEDFSKSGSAALAENPKRTITELCVLYLLSKKSAMTKRRNAAHVESPRKNHLQSPEKYAILFSILKMR